LLFTTDPDIVAHDLVLLEDDRKLQPAENVVPILRSDVLERYGPGLLTAIGEVTRRLSTSDLRTLNRGTELEGRSPRTVAREWLAQRGLVE
jgi:osmoprotectant transport system substrate-binding protein